MQSHLDDGVDVGHNHVVPHCGDLHSDDQIPAAAVPRGALRGQSHCGHVVPLFHPLLPKETMQPIFCPKQVFTCIKRVSFGQSPW